MSFQLNGCTIFSAGPGGGGRPIYGGATTLLARAEDGSTRPATASEGEAYERVKRTAVPTDLGQ